MGFDVNGKVALVTGANRGIGKAIVDALIAAGAKKVYAAVRTVSSADDLTKQYPGKITAIECDLAKPDTIVAAAKQATDVELVINNAGVFQPSDPFASQAIDSLQYQFDINVFGWLRVAQAFAPVLKANGGGALVQLNSVVSVTSFPDFATYCASKAASYSLTLSIRAKLADQKTQVLSVHPGPIATDMGSEAGLEEIAEPASVVGEGIVRALAAGDFHLWPDTFARDMGQHYASFGEYLLAAPPSEG